MQVEEPFGILALEVRQASGTHHPALQLSCSSVGYMPTPLSLSVLDWNPAHVSVS